MREFESVIDLAPYASHEVIVKSLQVEDQVIGDIFETSPATMLIISRVTTDPLKLPLDSINVIAA